MNNFVILSPEDVVKKLTYQGKKKSLAFWQRKAKEEAKPCLVCQGEKEWKLAGTGMCFTCTTGEADASEDYEIGVQESKG